MKRKAHLVWAAALLSAIVGSAGIAGAARSNRARVQVVYREDAAGDWQVFLFGLDPCGQNLRVDAPKDHTQPVELRCGK